ncbi:hypothetical protein VTK73DRAFT_9305 [Phialemonium thermophilum]|uniref:Ubiquitin carboxyl-terminal hydrolase n=1 Tax=Phialemonium thermophilum TaxID=223376 RepID=A0ABR3XLE8_9PEZI
MPEKTLTVATYAAGASLAAITLIYVFGPTYFLDSSPHGASSSSSALPGLPNRKKGVVGLANPANDCFINSVLQALAGLGDLRLYLIREIHRRSLDEPWVYANAVPRDARPAKNMPDWKVEGLQSGIVTKALKDMLDALNERPIYKKTISAAPFVRSLEVAFRQRISRQQQDAQEFLQVVAERLCDEYHAGRRARAYARRKASAAWSRPGALSAGSPPSNASGGHGEEGQPPSTALDPSKDPSSSHGGRREDTALGLDEASEKAQNGVNGEQHVAPTANGNDDDTEAEEEEGFPMEGRFESQIECLTCGFKPKPTESTFCTLTLNVPQTSSTSLNSCFDGMFKTEYIDDFKCEKCRLLHAISVLEAEMAKSTSESFRAKTSAAIAKLQAAVESDPEHPPDDVPLPDLRFAPKRRIARHVRLTGFPKIMAIHLSRSIYDASHLSQKNSAKVAFPERLPLGGLLHQRKYKLLATVTHKGSHHSGHYESFRRQSLHPPFSNPHTFQPSDVYSRSGSPAPTPRLAPSSSPRAQQQQQQHNWDDSSSALASNPDLLSPESSSSLSPSTPSLESSSTTAAARTGSASRDSPPLNGSSSSSTRPGRPSLTTAPASRGKDAKDITDTASLKSVAASARSTLSRITSRPSSSSRGASRNANGNGNGDSVASESAVSTAVGETTTNTTPVASPPPAPTPAAAIPKSKTRRHRHDDRWWRISDDKVKEASTRDVLGMRREVYLLFYELERQRP